MPRTRRRRFSAEYKSRVLHEADACTERGKLNALLEREGLYSSHLVAWRRARARGELAALAPRKRGPKPKATPDIPRVLAARDREIARLRAENARLRGLCETHEQRISRLLDEVRALLLGSGNGKRSE
jgi:transposase-like protein